MNRTYLVAVLLLLAGLTVGFAPPAQAPIITMSVEAGFDGRFRDNEWMPVIVALRNDGDGVSGRLVVRPETSGTGIINTYSAPVALPSGANQTVMFYITARNFAQQIRVDLIDDEGVVIAGETAPVRALLPLDRLYVVVTQSAAGSVDLSGTTIGGHDAFQANWRVQDVPDQASALGSVNVILFSDVDTAGLSLAQRRALTDWVMLGGHLIVTGGPAWQATAAAFEDLLPLEPQNSTTVDNLSGLTGWLHSDADLGEPTILATGPLTQEAEVLATANPSADTPLLVRRTFGSGVVDYLAADPNTAPLRGWDGLADLWYTLQTTVSTQPGWNDGFFNWDAAATAVEILPGFNLLPDVLPLCGFLGLYIALIGPINYFVLARFNRREFAWITIPILIVLFSALSWLVGFNLRGTEATVSRMSVVQTWADTDQARVDGLVGLLSPRRAQYTLTLNDGGTLRPIPRATSGGGFISNVQSSIEIQQTDIFRASNFSVDASFIAAFNTSTTLPRPDIGGTATFRYGAGGTLEVRGSVRNNTDFALNDPVLLVRGTALSLGGTLEPGAVETFDLPVAGVEIPAPGIFAPNSSVGGTLGQPYYNAYYAISSSPTVVDLLGQDTNPSGNPDDPAAEEDRRRRWFLASFVADYFATPSQSVRVTGSRGDGIYLAGWTSSAPQSIELQGAGWTAQDTTLYLVELATDFADTSGLVTITPDRFHWLVEDFTGLGEVAPLNLTLQSGDGVTFRYTPLPTARLDTVTQLVIRLDRPSSSTTGLPLLLYNWDSGDYEEVLVRGGEERINEPDRFIGPGNAVLVRLEADVLGGYFRLDRLVVEQRGRF